MLLLLAIGVYIELRLPVPIDAQGRAAVYERVSVTGTAADSVRIAGSLTVGSPIAPQYLGTGTRDGTKFLQDTGTWAGVSPPSASARLTGDFNTTSSTFQTTGLSISLTAPSATSDILIAANLNSITTSNGRCEVELRRGTTSIWSYYVEGGTVHLEFTLVDQDPGTGLHTYEFYLRKVDNSYSCRLNSTRINSQGIVYHKIDPVNMIGQVLQ